jgi:hypothetical protein
MLGFFPQGVLLVQRQAAEGDAALTAEFFPVGEAAAICRNGDLSGYADGGGVTFKGIRTISCPSTTTCRE